MEVSDAAVTYIPTGEGDSILVMTDLVTVKVRSKVDGAAFAFSEVSTPPLGGPPALHRHPDQETFYVLEGMFRFDTIQDDRPSSVEATSGAVIHIPGMVWHNYKNIGKTPGKLLVLLQPGGMIEFFKELGVAVGDQANPPRPSGPPDMARAMAIMQKHHVEILAAAVPG